LLGEAVVVWGGFSVQSSSLIYSNASMIYHTSNDTWETMPVRENNAPSPRIGHSCVKLNDTAMLIYGGNDLFTTFDTTYIFDIGTRVWTQITTTVAPITDGDPNYANITYSGVDNGNFTIPNFYARSGHRAQILYDRTAQRSLMFVFGGVALIPDNVTNVYVNELWALDLTDYTWYLVPSPNPPPPRSYYGSAVIDNQTMLVWGGVNASSHVFNDIYVYIYNDGFNAPVTPQDQLYDATTNYGVAGAGAGIMVVLGIIVLIVKCSEKKI